jgi:hypothetical protein
MKFKNAIMLIIILTGVLIACEKEEKYQSSGIITGPDIRACICCGGYFIEIDNSTYNFDTLPASSAINLETETFPITVNLDWSFDRNCGGIQYIEIIKIVKR